MSIEMVQQASRAMDDFRAPFELAQLQAESDYRNAEAVLRQVRSRHEESVIQGDEALAVQLRTEIAEAVTNVETLLIRKNHARKWEERNQERLRQFQGDIVRAREALRQQTLNEFKAKMEKVKLQKLALLEAAQDLIALASELEQLGVHTRAIGGWPDSVLVQDDELRRATGSCPRLPDAVSW